MSAGTQPVARSSPNGVTAELNEWRGHTRVFLQPIAAPSILGLFGFAVAPFMVRANLVGWYGNASSPLLIFPFAIWGAFWLGYGFLNFMIALKLVPAPAAHAAVPKLAYWFFAVAAVTLAGAIASLGESLAITSVLAPLAVGSALLGVFYVVGGSGWQHVAGYVTMASAFTAFYGATAMLAADTFGRVLLPLGKYRRDANAPGAQPMYPIQFALGEPGVKQGQ